MLEAMGYYEQPISSEFLVMVPMAFERNLLTNSDLDILWISMDHLHSTPGPWLPHLAAVEKRGS